MKAENGELSSKTKLTEAEVQRRAEALAAVYWRRWLAEEKPAVVASAVGEEVERYPYGCTASTRKVIDAKVEQRVQEEIRKGVYPIFFTISNAFKAVNEKEATVLPRVTATALPTVTATVISTATALPTAAATNPTATLRPVDKGKNIGVSEESK